LSRHRLSLKAVKAVVSGKEVERWKGPHFSLDTLAYFFKVCWLMFIILITHEAETGSITVQG
jgi:hypothetical protein